MGTDEKSDFLAELVGRGELSSDEAGKLGNMLSGAEQPDLPKHLLDKGVQPVEDSARESSSILQKAQREGLSEDEVTDLRTLISQMKLPEKIKLAIFGNSTCRALLINDPNTTVQLGVLKNPQLREGEVEMFSKNTNLSELVFREISNNRAWMKSYAIKINLVSNPRVPGDVSMRWLRFLNKADLRKLARSKNIPQVIAVNARKRLVDAEKRGE